ncbi:hypothetical protein OS493_025977 [Desmophyllum pertusum]|uniref:GP-PDE domain-containing protein n=1 Tax=Desmophyllum pertusum TaxID=174260 RepID=A0A9X0CJE2_9CNID|nr:hypothetical protein OS493_025977 [Desmophyllum pertusum]
MEFDTFLTKDKKLVVFHYENTMTLTKKNHYIWNTTYEELQKLSLPTELKYGNEYYQIRQTTKNPLAV